MSAPLGAPNTPSGTPAQPAPEGTAAGHPAVTQHPPPAPAFPAGQQQQTGEGFSGWGQGGQRFGGMAQAGLRDPEQGNAPGPAPSAPAPPSRPAGASRTPSFASDSSTATSSASSLSSVMGAPSIRGEVSDTEADAGAGIGGAGYGRPVTSLDEDEARRIREERGKRGGARRPGAGGRVDAAKSFTAGMGQTQGYMRMIHALAQDDEEEERRAQQDRKHKRRGHKHHHHKHLSRSEGAGAGEPVSPAQQVASTDFAASPSPSPAREGEDDSSASASQQGPDLASFVSPPERAAQNPSLARCDSGLHRADEHDAALAAPQRRKKRHGGRGGEDLSKSSIFAIHRPIEERRRTMEDVREARAAEESAEGSAAEEDAEGSADEGTHEERKAREKERRLARRAKLAEKLMDVFGLDEAEEVVAEYPCWLFRAILLQGFLYITSGHLCFYAYLAQKEGATIRSGSLSVRSSRTRRYNKHWFVLKDSVFSWFPSSTDPYFPDGHIDLHYAISVEPSSFHKHHFKVATADKKWHFSADSEASRDEWVKTLKKGVFRCQNEGESVKIAIPLETIVDAEKSSSLEFAETIRVRVYDADEGYSIDEYWLSYFKDLDGALDKINTVLETFRRHHPNGTSGAAATQPEVEDTTKQIQTDLGDTDQVKGADGEHDHSQETRSRTLSERVSSVLSGSPLKRSSSKSSRKSTPSVANTPASTSSGSSDPQPATAVPPKLRVSTEVARASTPTPTGGSVATLRAPAPAPIPAAAAGEDAVALEGVSPMAAAAAATPLPPPVGSPPKMEHDGTVPSLAPAAAPSPAPAASDATSETASTLSPPPAPLDTASANKHTYPPEPSPGPAPEEVGRPGRRASTLSKVLSAPASAASSVSQGGRKILEVVTHSSVPGRSRKRAKSRGGMGGAVAEDPQEEDENEGEGAEGEVEEFRRVFGLQEKEELLEQFPAYLFRGLPIYGRVYISSNYFCFRSSGILAAKTKMILPLNDIIGVSKHRSYRIGFSGLMVIIKGHEEVFFELSNAERRDACLDKLEQQRDLVKKQQREKAGEDGEADTEEHQQLRELLDLSASKSSMQSPLDLPHPRSEAVPGQPPIMFSSTTSDFITFKPDEPLRFTCLTIGSRGDVQPYIALCKGLMAQGHRCKIASHGEYRKWVEGHGIEFSAVGGDPAELMQLMISHDFFTISFMKEAVGRFRGWLDDLLASAWKGCQDTDVLIESPSAIAGYHIAEALRVPYYRAFTMPWSRTRAYPHAFAVPDVHMGGGYNYMTYTMFDQVFWRATSSQVNRWRKQTLKLRPTSLEAMQQHKIPFLYNFSPVVIPPPLDWRENIHVTGYWWLDNPDDSKSKKWEPPQELIDFLDEAEQHDKKVVFIGFGSIIIPDPLEMTRVVVEAAERAGVYAIVAKGWSDRQAGGKDDDGEPDEEQKRKQEETEQRHQALLDKPFIFSVKSIPHDWLFPRIAAAVHHGGAGTTGASLRAGLPTIIKPFFGDQHFYADRVATLGIGTHIRNFTVENLADALTAAVSDEKQIERARLAGEEIRKEDGVATAIECIYRDLEYAKSLIPPPTNILKDGDADDDNADACSSSSSSSDGSSSSDEEEDEKDEKKLLEADAVAHDEKGGLAPAASATAPTATPPPSRPARDPASPLNESRTTSSDEGWDVMSRGSAAETNASASWEDGADASRASSRARSASTREGAAGDVADDEGGAGLTARVLGFLGKPVKAIKKEP
ncbi:Sterol 3-beta-glucosyltransferase [Rhodotorula kratochvilovae]